MVVSVPTGYPSAIVAQLTAGDPAPPFELPDQNGDVVRLSDFQGKVVLDLTLIRVERIE